MVCGCGAGASVDARIDDTGAVLPDTHTLNDVLVMDHHAAALRAAQQFLIDDTPSVVYDGGMDRDLALASHFSRLRDRRAVALIDHGVIELVVLSPGGSQAQVLARQGEGPGELNGSGDLVLLPGDTIVVFDHATRRVSWFSADSGFIRTQPIPGSFPTGCFGVDGQLPDGRLVGTGRCGSHRITPEGQLSASVPLARFDIELTSLDTIAVITGSRIKWSEIDVGGRTERVMTWPSYGQMTTVAVAGSTIVVGSGEGGYAINLLDGDGRMSGRIVVDIPSIVVNNAFRDRVAEVWIARRGSNVSQALRDSIRDRVRAETFADTVAAYHRVMSAPGGTIWVIDQRLPGDTVWSATAFRRDGAITGRLVFPIRLGDPHAFGDDDLVLMHEDEDGIVRYHVHPLRTRDS